ncbi:MAG: hypothetical protein F4Y87_01765 [Synechococcus sp. SB0665_bin_28]|nr:hypothetical protein [Synechococcus sp. SB0665_bin_28]MYF19312.1 hypothetical protein [Synechococcus sp. SB0677_bin_5]
MDGRRARPGRWEAGDRDGLGLAFDDGRAREGQRRGPGGKPGEQQAQQERKQGGRTGPEAAG